MSKPLSPLGVGAFAAAAWLLFASGASAANCTGPDRADADRWLWLNANDKQLSISQHLPWGAPTAASSTTHEHLLVQRDYVIDHDDELRLPIWTAHRIVSSRLGRVGRIDCFRKNVRIEDRSASTPTDYDERIFDQGHMVPNGDMSMSKRAVLNSFVMSNMAPQFCQFNRGVWQILEALVREWARNHASLYVISGSILDRDGDGARDADSGSTWMKPTRRVAIPSAFYKILAYERPEGGLATLTVLLPHDQTDLDRDEAIAYLGRNVRTIAEIEALTGLHFFPSRAADDTLSESNTLWEFAGAAPRSLATGSVQCAATAGAVLD
jgi:endonuclease G